MDKLKLAHEYALEMAKQGIPLKSCKELGWKYADAMQAELDKRNKAEAAQKRKEIREMLNAPNTFVEREGQHFDDVEEWQPDWSQAPEWAKWWYVTDKNNPKWCSKKPYQDGCNWFVGANETYSLYNAPSFGYTGNWKESLRERPHGF